MLYVHMESEYNLFVYGSLMSMEELDDMFDSYSCIPVKLNGFVRDFSKGSLGSWSGDSELKRVLSIQEAEDKWCNGLIVTGVSEAEFKDYIDREAGYRMEIISEDKFEPYEGSLDISGPIFSAIRDWLVEDAPISDSYKSVCADAAALYGHEFLTDFEESTVEFHANQSDYSVIVRQAEKDNTVIFDVTNMDKVRETFLEADNYSNLEYDKRGSNWGLGELIFREA